MIKVKIESEEIICIARNIETGEEIVRGGIDYVIYCLNYKGLDGKKVYQVVPH